MSLNIRELKLELAQHLHHQLEVERDVETKHLSYEKINISLWCKTCKTGFSVGNLKQSLYDAHYF